jgi:phage terminase Nu1 subunit (DNA packaging protein)
LTSAQARLQNFTKAQENHEFIQLELERIESKIASIAEMAINRQDPDFITHEVDGVASTMEQTEHAMGELQFLDGLGEVDVAPPSFVQDLETLEQK